MKELREFLAARLSDAELERLGFLTSNWTENPFEYYPESQTIETSDQWVLSHLDLSDEDVELLVRVCEMLQDALPNVLVPVHVDAAPQKMTRKFLFLTPDKDDAAERFCRLLQDRPGYQVVTEQRGERMIVAVTFWFRSEWEYAQQMADIKMLFDMAQARKRVQSSARVEMKQR